MQLTLWVVRTDFWGNLRREKEAGVEVFYHFNGVALPMISRKKQVL